MPSACVDDLTVITHMGEHPMNNSSVKLKLFGGSTLKPLGERNLLVKHNGRRHTLKFQVIEHKLKS